MTSKRESTNRIHGKHGHISLQVINGGQPIVFMGIKHTADGRAYIMYILGLLPRGHHHDHGEWLSLYRTRLYTEVSILFEYDQVMC